MTTNDFLKPYYETPVYSGRYLVFAFEQSAPGGGQQDIVGNFNTLEEIETAFIIDPTNKYPIGHINKKGDFEGDYQFIEVLDLIERRFIDINELHFKQLS